jgi:uncharacterized delta-60 repeat protein
LFKWGRRMTTQSPPGCNPTAPNHRGPRARRALALLAALSTSLALLPATAQAGAGDFDSSFAEGGQLRLQIGRDPTVPASWANDVALQSDGKLVLGGVVSDPNARHANEFMIARLNLNGAVDTTFGTDGSVQLQLANALAVSHVFQDGQDLSSVYAIAVQPDGKIIAAGSAKVGENSADDDHQEFALARFNPDGSLDPSFGSGGIVHVQPNQPGARIYDIALQPDGKIIAAGFAQDNTVNDGTIDLAFAVVRLNPDGAPDASFGNAGKVVAQLGRGLGAASHPSSGAYSVVIQPDGRIVLAGSATDMFGNDEFALARFNSDGAVDASFDADGRVTTQVADSGLTPASVATSLALRPDGKLIAGGAARDLSSDAREPWQVALARFNSDGGLDSTFGSAGKVLVQMADDDSPTSSLSRIALQDDGKIVGSGAAGPSPPDGATASGFLLARFNANGSIDSSFGTAGKVTVQMGEQDRGFPPRSNASALALQPDKKVVAAGFGTYPEASNQIGVVRVFGGPAPVASFDFAPAAPKTGEAVAFNSTSSAPGGGSIVRSEWDFGDGFHDGPAQISHTFASSGDHDVSLRVTDDQGQTATVTRQVAVADRPPAAAFSFTPAAPKTGESVAFDGSASTDPDGSVVAYAWDFGDGAGGSGASPSHAYAAAGSYTVMLTVTDDDGATASVSRTVTVATRAVQAAFSFSPSAPSTGQAVSFDGSGSSASGGSVSGYSWTFGDGASATGATPSHAYAKAGSYTVTLTATGSDGGTDSVSHTVTVANRLPVASIAAAPEAPLTGEQVTFDASGSSDPDGSITRYEWDLDGDGTFETDTGTDPRAARSYARSGSVTVGVRVRDDDGASTTSSRVVNVADRPPVAALTATPNPALVGQVVTFDASASDDPDGSITRYEWDLDGDGTYETDTAATPTTSRSYEVPGAVTVGVRVSDDHGGISQTSVAVQIDSRPIDNSGSGPPADGGTDPGATDGEPVPVVRAGDGLTQVLPPPPLVGSLGLLKGQTLRAVLRRGIAIVVRCSTACRATVAVTLDLRAARALFGGRSSRALVIARATRQLKGGPAVLNARLSAAAKRLLRKARRLTASVRVRLIANDGTALTLKRKLVVRR